jgi:hypothetical protein
VGVNHPDPKPSLDSQFTQAKSDVILHVVVFAFDRDAPALNVFCYIWGDAFEEGLVSAAIVSWILRHLVSTTEIWRRDDMPIAEGCETDLPTSVTVFFFLPQRGYEPTLIPLGSTRLARSVRYSATALSGSGVEMTTLKMPFPSGSASRGSTMGFRPSKRLVTGSESILRSADEMKGLAGSRLTQSGYPWKNVDVFVDNCNWNP